MKKICRQCHSVYDDLSEKDEFCESCGGKLSEVTKDVSSTDIPTTHLQQDNSIHKGDKLNVVGDNFNAQSVDKRTVTTNNTIIQNIVDDTKTIVQCELSGRRVLQLETAVCPSCKRCVSLIYYVEKYRLCQECYEEKYHTSATPLVSPAAASGTSAPSATPSTSATPSEPAATSKAGIPAMVQSSGGNQVHVPMEPIRNGGGSSKKWIFIVIFIALAVGIFWMVKGSPEENASQKGVDPVLTEGKTATPEVAAPPTGSNAAVQSAPKQTASPSAPKTTVTQPAATAATNPPAAAENKDQFTLGKQAYDAGNFTKASIFLEQALGSGKYAAAYYLSVMHRDGKGVGKNVKKAFTYMKQAAEGGYSGAYYELAQMYRTGVGTEANRAQAKGWYEKAIASDSKDSDKAADALNKFYR